MPGVMHGCEQGVARPVGSVVCGLTCIGAQRLTQLAVEAIEFERLHGRVDSPRACHRHHAGVEDSVRTNKAMGLAICPSFTVNQTWMLTANLAADLDVWLRLLTLHDKEGLADAEPEAIRFRLNRLPARLAKHARRRWLCVETTWPWASAFTTAWTRIADLPTVT
ncbi:transposase [Streptomyces sp. NPDC005065]|uniref:transposase n=2 Tax=unclassified Streptomyces TaxID=2593676 RepID=UPI0033A16F2D